MFIKIIDIKFHKESGNFLLILDASSFDARLKSKEAKQFGLHQKTSYHITIVGDNTCEKILQTQINQEDLLKKLGKLEFIAKNTIWNISLKNEFFFIEKCY